MSDIQAGETASAGGFGAVCLLFASYKDILDGSAIRKWYFPVRVSSVNLLCYASISPHYQTTSMQKKIMYFVRVDPDVLEQYKLECLGNGTTHPEMTRLFMRQYVAGHLDVSIGPSFRSTHQPKPKPEPTLEDILR